MISFLSKIFIEKRSFSSASEKRSAYGSLCCITGIILNIFLFAFKYFAGVISGSIAVTADAFNNLSDAGSSVITLAGLRLARKKPDSGHPFGHGRMEYLSGLAVSVIIILVGIELMKSSVDKIMNPSDIDSGSVTIIILVVSVFVKLYMFLYNRKTGKMINSSAMKATATDSIGDAVATFVVLVSSIVSVYTDIRLDGWCGVFVSLFILYAGIRSVKETVDPLLGSPPEKEFVDKIESIVMSYDKIEGIHDLIVHDYGPGRIVVSLHAEVNGNENIYEIHDMIDNAEQQLAEELGCIAVIHMDPVETDNGVMNEMRESVADIIRAYDSSFSVHDFRMVPGTSHTNLIFDVVVPHSIKNDDNEIASEISRIISEKHKNCNAVIKIDRPFV